MGDSSSRREVMKWTGVAEKVVSRRNSSGWMEILLCVYKQVKLVPKGALMRADTPYPTGWATVRKSLRVDGRNKAALSFVSTIQLEGYNTSVLIKTDRPTGGIGVVCAVKK